MKPDPAAPADQLNLLRQQLILAQVRIMELEDTRDSLTPRLQELALLLQQAQSLADHKTDEAAHLEEVLAETQLHVGQLQALQHHLAQEATTHGLAMTEAVAALAARTETINRLQNELNNLRSELNHLHSSRSWRWTAWLRSPGRKP
jgi:chromosome segregation ATPase